ncbi:MULTISPECIES: hypothetical protein [Streptomyces]|nr:hypothetical protein [Streptomyces sp. NEAU-HV9]
MLHGAPVAPGSSVSTRYDVLRTLPDLAGLTTHAGAARAPGSTGMWN